MTPQECLINTALSQVGYDADAGKYNKYAAVLDKMGFVYNGPKNGFDWCDIFVDWCFISTFGDEKGMEMIYQPKRGSGAGCPFSADFYRAHGAFYFNPKPGDQIFFGTTGDEYHTGIVTHIADGRVYTVEGNTGGGAGHVMKKSYPLGSGISGYGRPDWSLATTATPKTDIEKAAAEVIAGKWGYGSERYNRLRAAGYDPDQVQDRVNAILKKETNERIAREVIAGKWDYGSKRYEKLRAAGYDPEKVQAKVNAILVGELNERIARDVIAGKWGDGAARKKALTKAGFDYDAIQDIVNSIIRG